MNRNIIVFLVIASLLMFAALSPAEGGNAVSAGMLFGMGDMPLALLLREEEDISLLMRARVSADMLEEIDVLIVTQQSNPSITLGGRAGEMIRSWVEEGGGVILIHDAVGYRAHKPLFPSVGEGVYHPKLGEARVAAEHPVTGGLEVGEVFTQGFQYDHVIVEPGEAGEVVVYNENDDAVVVVGKAGEGRVVLNGMLTGRYGEEGDGGGRDREGYPEGAERKIFLNALRWLAGVD